MTETEKQERQDFIDDVEGCLEDVLLLPLIIEFNKTFKVGKLQLTDFVFDDSEFDDDTLYLSFKPLLETFDFTDIKLKMQVSQLNWLPFDGDEGFNYLENHESILTNKSNEKFTFELTYNEKQYKTFKQLFIDITKEQI